MQFNSSKSTKNKKTKKVAIHTWPMSLRVAAVVFVLGFGIVGGIRLVRSFAATAPLYLTPATQNVVVGQTVSLDVRVNASSPVDGVEATVTYDPALMDFVSIDSTSSAFPVELLSTGGNGQVKIARGILAPSTVSGDALVARLTFKANVAATNSATGLVGNLTYQGAYLNVGTAGAAITITSPVQTPPPPAADTTAPVVRITQPVSGATPLRGKFNIVADASDAVGVVKMQISIDGSVVLTSASSSVSYMWNTSGKKIPTGNHVIVVRGYDAAGNVGSSTVNVRK